VVVHLLYLMTHSPPPEFVGEIPFDEGLDQNAERVRGSADTGEDEGDGEQLLAVVEMTDLAEAHGGDGDDGLEDCVDEPVAEGHVAHRAGHEDDEQADQARPKLPGRPGPAGVPGPDVPRVGGHVPL
jgi:hypothetical protein